MSAFCRIVRKFAAELFKQDIWMKNILMTLCVLLGASMMLTGCINSDNDTTMTTYGNMAITNVTLGTINRYTQTTSSTTGNDTIVKSTYTGSGYPLSIDQLNGRIYNQTELPVGSDLGHVVISISTMNNGIVGIKSLISDSIRTFVSTDSIDFTQPRTLRVYATDGSGYRDYTMTLTASETTGTKFEWLKVEDDPVLADWDDNLRLVVFKDTVSVVSEDVVLKGDVAFGLEDGQLMRSTDLQHWQSVASAPRLSHLFASGTNELFAIGTDGKVKHSEDDGITWTDETLDDEARLFPTEGLASVTWNYRNSDSTDYVLVVGNHPEYPELMAVWRKISQYGGIGKGGVWAYMPVDDTNDDMLPYQGLVTLAYYNNKVLAMNEGMVMLESRDQGITWKPSTDYVLPNGVTGTQALITASDKTGIWVLTNSGQVWHGMKR